MKELLNLKENKSIWFSLLLFSLLFSLCFIAHPVFAQDTGGGDVGGGLLKWFQSLAGNVVGIIRIVAYVAGVGFIFTSFFKFDQHKKNPTQIPLSQPLTLLAIGAGLCVLPTILNGLVGATGGKNDQNIDVPSIGGQ